MPEIWLRYGTTDVVLDIKFENLASHVSSPFQPLPEEQVKEALARVPVSDGMLVLALSPSKAAARTVAAIAEAARARGFSSPTVDVPQGIAGALRANLAAVASSNSTVGGSGGSAVTTSSSTAAGAASAGQQHGAAVVSINRIDYHNNNNDNNNNGQQREHQFEERLRKFQSTVIVSQAAYDPLFGFAGAPTAILRSLHAGAGNADSSNNNNNNNNNTTSSKMAEAFNARQGNRPSPGVRGAPLKVATDYAEEMQQKQQVPAITSIELVANGSGVAGIHVGGIVEAFSKATSQLQSISSVEVSPDPKSAIILSASGEAGTHSTLASSLNSLWNSVHAVKEGGSAILLAENREGIGGGALQMFAEGRLKQEQLWNAPYVDGLEHLLYMHELRQKYELGLVSTIPHYYAKTRLGFATYSGMKDVVEKMLARHGRNCRALVVSDADITLLVPRQPSSPSAAPPSSPGAAATHPSSN